MSTENAISIPLPADDDLGPAMRRLTDMQKKYVIAYLMNPTLHGHTQAAIIAGYGKNRHDTAKHMAWLLSHNEKVQAAMREEADRRIRTGAIIASSRLLDIVEDKTHKDNFKAVVEVLNRAGLIVETQHRVVVERDDDMMSVIERVKKQAVALGLDPAMLLKKVGLTIDGKSEMAPDPTDPRNTATDAVIVEDEEDEEWTV